MGEIVLYHGSFNKVVVPQYGLGETKHDYGKGFYLTENVELAKEWAVCRPDETNGWVHKFELDTKDLKVLDFQQYNVLSWLAELQQIQGVIRCCLKSLLRNMGLIQANMML